MERHLRIDQGVRIYDEMASFDPARHGSEVMTTIQTIVELPPP